MNHIISIADSYLYPQLVWGLYVELVVKRKRDEKPSQQRVMTARQLALTYLAVLNQFLIGKDWFACREISLADLYVAPMLDHVMLLPGAKEMLLPYPELERWWKGMMVKESFAITHPDATK